MKSVLSKVSERVAPLARDLKKWTSPEFYDADYFDNPLSGKGYPGFYNRDCAPWKLLADAVILGCSPSKVVEFGSAKGFLLRELETRKEDPVKVKGYDFSLYAVVNAESDRISLQDVSIPFKPQKGDTWLCVDMLEHIHPDQLVTVFENAGKTGATKAYLHIGVAEQHGQGSEDDPGHCIVEPEEWWIALLEYYGWRISLNQKTVREFLRGHEAAYLVAGLWSKLAFVCERDLP